MTFTCIGIGVTPGIAIGEVHLVQRGLMEVAPEYIRREQIPDEVDRFRQAGSFRGAPGAALGA